MKIFHVHILGRYRDCLNSRYVNIEVTFTEDYAVWLKSRYKKGAIRRLKFNIILDY